MITEHKLTVVDVDADKWLFIYDNETLELACEPFQTAGSYNCVNNLVVADTQQECYDYIRKNKLVNPFYTEPEYKSDDL
jgi:hypothetical protein